MANPWTTEAYQASAAFVPQLTATVVSWLDLQPDDRLLDIGCGDGVLDAQFAAVLARGSGNLHGIDSSPAMVAAAERATAAQAARCSFTVVDAAAAELPPQSFDAIFSNAALHWILHAPATRLPFLRRVHAALAPGGRFVFELGGLGNVAAPRAALHAALARRIGPARARAADPWFFPDEHWLRAALAEAAHGAADPTWRVVRLETEWRPTPVPDLTAWVRLMGASFLQLLPDSADRDACVAEIVDAITPAGSYSAAPDHDAAPPVLGYVRLRCHVVKDRQHHH